MTITLAAVRLDADKAPERMWLSSTFEKAADDETRILSGTFAPYEVEIDRLNWMLGTTRFRIAAEALTVQDVAKAFYGHDWQTGGMPIGRVTDSTNSATELAGDLTLSTTTKADEVLSLTKDSTLNRFSVGFNITAYEVEDADTDAPVLVITAGEVFEVSVVPYPAFDGAEVRSVNSSAPTPRSSVTLHERTHMDPETDTLEVYSAADGQALSEAVTQLTRQVATLGDNLGDASPSVPFSSYGEFVKAMLNGSHERHAEAVTLTQTLAYGDADGEGKVADTVYRDTWVGDIIRLIEKPRKVWGLFDSSPLPAEGMGVEYGVLKSNTIDVAKQLKEGDALVMGEVSIGTGRADVITFGGAAKQSFQQAQRSNVNVLDLTWRALAIAYGKTTEQYVRAILADATKVTPKRVGALADLTTVDGWIEFLVDVALHFDDKGLAGEYLRVTSDVYKGLATLRLGTDGPFLLDRSTGSINLAELTGNVAGLPVKLVPGDSVVEVGHSSAIRTFESSGAPARLGPEQDILTLTQAIGVYGFDAVAVQDPDAIVRPTGGRG